MIEILNSDGYRIKVKDNEAIIGTSSGQQTEFEHVREQNLR